MGDRFHFRSALISFRRIWMPSESGYWGRVIKILTKVGMPSNISGIADTTERMINVDLQCHGFPAAMSQERIVELWLNCVFAHDGLKGKNRRADFEAAVTSYGHPAFEFAFRSAVKKFGNHFINLQQLCVEPTLRHLQTAHGLGPSFSIVAAFGTDLKEINADGVTIQRQASSEHYTPETPIARMHRLLDREEHCELKAVVDSFRHVAPANIFEAISSATTTFDFVAALGGKLRLGETDPGRVASPEVVRCHNSIRSRFLVYLDGTLQTDMPNLAVIDAAIEKFRAEMFGST